MSSLLDKFTEVEEAVEFSGDKQGLNESHAQTAQLKLSSEEVVYWRKHASIKSNSKEYLADISDQLALDKLNLSVCSKFLNVKHISFVEKMIGFIAALLEQAEPFFESTRHQNCLRLKSTGEWVNFEFIKAIKDSEVNDYEQLILQETQLLLEKQNEFQPVFLKYNFSSQEKNWVAYAVSFSLPVENKKISNQKIIKARAASL